MSHTMFDFLAHSLLLDQSLISKNYEGESEHRLQLELERYREHSISKLTSLTKEITNVGGSLSCVGSPEMSSLSNLKRSALYVEQMVLPDPIFPFTAPKNSMSLTMSSSLGMNTGEQKIDRIALAKAVKDILSKRDLVVGGYLKYYPTSLHSEPPIQIPIHYESNGHTDFVPKPILQIFKEKSEILTAKSTPDGLIVTDYLEPCRTIFLRFKGSRAGSGFIYNLMSQETLSFNEETRTAQFRLNTPTSPPSQSNFDKWIEESLVRSASNHFRALINDISLSHRLKSVYACSSSFDSQILRSSMVDIEKGIPENAIECVLKMNLPYMDKINPQDLMRLRNSDGEAFQNFRADLESRFRELRHEQDPSIIQRKITDIEHEMSEVQLRLIATKLKTIRKAALADVGLAFGGLAASVVTSGVSLLGTLSAALHGAKTYVEYKNKVSENPCYFLFSAKNLKNGSAPSQRKPKKLSKNRSSVTGARITQLNAIGGTLRDSED